MIPCSKIHQYLWHVQNIVTFTVSIICCSSLLKSLDFPMLEWPAITEHANDRSEVPFTGPLHKGMPAFRTHGMKSVRAFKGNLLTGYAACSAVNWGGRHWLPPWAFVLCFPSICYRVEQLTHRMQNRLRLHSVFKTTLIFLEQHSLKVA